MKKEILLHNRTWAEVDLDAIAHNIQEIKKKLARNTEIMGVVKADSYGHGVFETAQTILDNGASRLAVSMLDEAIQLRRMGINAPILIMSYTDPVRAEEIIKNNITQTVYSEELASQLSVTAVKLNKPIKIHIKIDTGMTRVGFTPGYESVKTIARINGMPGIIIEGIFTHFSKADELDGAYTDMQFERFMTICSELKRIGVIIPVKHAANSAASMTYPDMHLDMIRPGIIQYGLYPSHDVDKSLIDLKPAMSLKSNIIMINKIEEGTCVSYGGTFTALRESYIATIPIGYADGYSRLLSNKSKVLIKGRFAPVVGNICMDQCMIDITDLVLSGDIVSIGDETILFGQQDGNRIDVTDLADIIGTINYELVCIIGKRVPRFYIKDGKVEKVLNYLID